MNQSIVLAPPPGALASLPQAVRADPLDRIDPGALIAFLRRRWPVMLGALLTALAIGFVVIEMQTPTYLATAEVTLDPKVEPIAPLTDEDRLAAQGSMGETWIDTQVEVITSSHNVAAVVDKLDLAHRFASDKRNVPDGRQVAIDYVAKGVSAFRSGATYTLSISFESEDRQEAPRIANAFAAQYTQGSVTDKEAADTRALAKIGARMNKARVQASTDAAALAHYRLVNDLPSSSDRSLTEQEISAYNQEVTSARAQAAEDVARLTTARQQLGAGSSGEDVGESLDSPVIASLRQQQSAYAAEIASLSGKYGPRHPDLQRARNQLASVNTQIAEEIGRVVSNLSAKASVSQHRLASLSGSLRASEDALRRDNIAMVGLQDLEQRAQASRQLYESYLGRYKELAARIGIRPPQARILHPARPSDRPAHPDIVLTMVLAGAIGLGLGLLGAIAAELMFSGFSTGEEIERRLGLRYLCAIPEFGSVASRKQGSDPVDAVVEQPRSAFAEAFRNLRASIAFAVENPRIIAVTSALPAEGKTTVALCLARSMAGASDAILLIDCDVRRRGVSRWIDGTREAGLLEVLRGNAKLEDAIVIDSRTGLSILPLSATHEEDHALLTGPAMDALLATTAQAFDAVIMDTAPVLPIADARLLLGKADAAVIATRWRRTPEAALRSMLRFLPEGAVGLAGVILTRVDIRKQAAFGLDENAFYKAYRDYYA
ncbi:MAG: polysaccharide biosynthesis tyrosine autokinase [Novosphingobium sp.]